MIQTYIRDEALRARWDINDPRIRPLHQSITRGWIDTADEIRAAIRTGESGDAHTASPLWKWLWGNINRLQEADLTLPEPWTDLVMDAYLEWGVRNYPITDRITQHTLAALEQLYHGDHPEAMMWDEYLRKVEAIIRYQAERNRKAPESMTREEMIRHIGTQDAATLRKMLAAVEYQAGR